MVALLIENGVLASPATGCSCVRAASQSGLAAMYHTSSVLINSVSPCVYLFKHLTHSHNLHGAVYGNEYTCLTPVTPVIASNSRNFQPADPSSPARFTASPARLISLNALLPFGAAFATLSSHPASPVVYTSPGDRSVRRIR